MLKSLVLSAILFLVVACNSSPSNTTESSNDGVTCKATDAECTASMWRINSGLAPLPQKMEMTLSNGRLVFNNCTNVGIDRLTINPSRSFMIIENMGLPQGSKVGFKIVDKGTNCLGTSTFFTNSDMRFEPRFENGSYVVIFNLASP